MTRKRFELFSTCFDKKGRPLASGVNDYHKSHPLMLHFAKLAGESPDKIWKHSELEAVLQCKSKEIDSILVQRFDAFGRTKLARPCKTCQQMLKGFGVRLVRYTTDQGIKEELVEDM